MKNAYMIVTDMHLFYKNLRNRVNYQMETDLVWKKIYELVHKYETDYNVNVIFLGDIFHRGYQDSFSAVTANNAIRVLQENVHAIYSVMGNHEVSYYKDNPFYTLVKDIESKKLTEAGVKLCKPIGLSNVVHVVDELTDGEVTFYFNHSGVDITAPTGGGVNIGLFHQDIVSPAVVARAEEMFDTTVYGKTMDVEGSGILNGYQYSFFGHMHQIFGMYALDTGAFLYYLASLGRTSTVEVNDNFLTRDIPVVIVDDGKFTRIEKNLFELPKRSDCVLAEDVEDDHEKYEGRKEIKAAREYSFNGDDPMQELLARLNDNTVATQIAKELAVNPMDEIGAQLFREVDAYGN